MKERYCAIYVTFPDRDSAKKTSERLVENKLVACANIFTSVESIFIWQGKLCKEGEVVCIFKTLADKYEDVENLILENHPYECPAILMFPVERGFKGFLDWIKDSVS